MSVIEDSLQNISYQEDVRLTPAAKLILSRLEVQGVGNGYRRQAVREHFRSEMGCVKFRKAWNQLVAFQHLELGWIKNDQNNRRCAVYFTKSFLSQVSQSEMDGFIQKLEESSPYATLPRFSQHGFVYLFRRNRDGIYKIGITKTLSSRAAAIARSCGSHITLIACADTPKCKEIETALHNRLNQYRTVGEWFDLDEEMAQKVSAFLQGLQTKKPENDIQSNREA